MSTNLIYKRQLAMFEALRRLGFAADDIYVAYNHGHPITVLRAQGIQFVADYPAPDPAVSDNATYEREWTEAAEEWKRMENEQRMEIFRDHFQHIPGAASGLVVALLAKGFKLPRSMH